MRHVSRQGIRAKVNLDIIKFVIVVLYFRLMALTALSVCAEVPSGRTYLLSRLDQIKALADAKEPLVAEAARECLDVIQWTP